MAGDGHACSSCGAANPPGARFCVNCGQPQTSPVVTEETRQVVTSAFVDLVGSTPLTERLDPEEAREVVRRFYGVVQDAVDRFDGKVANFLGDAVLAVFGLPGKKHEDDPERAVRAALAVRDALPALNEDLSAAYDVRLAVRVGINTGEVVAASGSTFERDFLVADAVTTAHRLQATVDRSDVVVVGERTYGLTRDAIEYRSLPPMRVKGKEAVLNVWEALRPIPESERARRVIAPLIGRQDELGLLRYLYRRSRDEGLVNLVTILGQAGVGKSRLLREFLADIRESEPAPMVLRGRSIAFGTQIGYHALLDILRSQADVMATDVLAAVRGKLQAWLGRVLPGREDVLEGLMLIFGLHGDAPSDPSTFRRHLFQAWQELVGGLAATRPVILTFEDAHWADDGLLDLIELLGQLPPPAALFIGSLARPELLERRPTWGAGRRNVLTMDLPPLPAPEAEQLAAALSGEALGLEIRRTITERAQGNPLFIEELVRMLLEGSAPGMTIPDTVQAVVTARIDRLPSEERRALQAAAVIGRAFWASAVSALAGLEPEERESAIQGLVRKELVIRRPQSVIPGEPEYAFRQILTRDVSYNMLPKTQRARGHALAGQWLETTLGDRVEDVVEILGEHFRMAGDDARAVAYLHRAAEKARRLYANVDAIRLYDQAIEVAGKAAVPDRDIAALRLGRGEVRQLLGEYRAALADFEEARTLAHQVGDRALEGMLENRVGLIHHREARFDDAERHFTRAVHLARESGDERTLGLSLVDLANLVWDRGQLDPADPGLQEGIRLLRQAGDLSGLARALNMLCMANLGAGNGPAGIAAAEEALQAARGAGDKSKEATSLSYLSVVYWWTGRYEQAARHAEAAIALAEQIGDRRRVAYSLGFLAYARHATGDWGEAIRLNEQAIDLQKQVAPYELPWTYFYLGLEYFEIGDIGKAKEMFRASGDEGEVLKSTAWRALTLLSRMYLAYLERDRQAADALLDELKEIPVGSFAPADAAMLLPLGTALLEMGRTDDVAQFVQARAPVIERFDAPAYTAGLRVIQALLASRQGQAADARVLVDEAVRLAEQDGEAVVLRYALETRLRLIGQDEDRDRLRAHLRRLADALPEDLRQTFLASPRVTPYLAKATSA